MVNLKRTDLVLLSLVGALGSACYSAGADLEDERRTDNSRGDPNVSGVCEGKDEPVELSRYCPTDRNSRPFAVLLCGRQHCGNREPLDLLATVLNCTDRETESGLALGLFASEDSANRGAIVRTVELQQIAPRDQIIVGLSVPFGETIALPADQATGARYWSYQVMPVQDDVDGWADLTETWETSTCTGHE